MITANRQPDPVLRSLHLNRLTQGLHNRLEEQVKGHDPFASRKNFACLVAAQYLFQSDLENFYADPGLARLLPGLAGRCLIEQTRLDLSDLGKRTPLDDGVVRGLNLEKGIELSIGLGTGLGWLFVSEGSKLGAAVLSKRAEALQLNEHFGARHLAEPEGGRVQGWKTFVAAFDGIELSAEQERLAEVGAIAAFQRFAMHLKRCFA